MGYCGEEGVELYHDPKSPAMDTDPCLCIDCASSHYEEEAERLNEEAQADGIPLEITCEAYPND